jgi:hypothetical protein
MKARVPESIRAQVKAAADQELMTESAWLKRLVLRELRALDRSAELCRGPTADRPRTRAAGERTCRRAPINVRLRPDDRALLEARAAARGMRPATYLSVLTRTHLRRLAPLPREELVALKRSTSELAVIGRNLNQIARSAHEGKIPGPAREEFRAMLKICEALRDNTKALIKANVDTWETGYDEADV